MAGVVGGKADACLGSGLSVSINPGQMDGEAAACPGGAEHLDAAPQAFERPFHDGQTQASSWYFADIAGSVEIVKKLRNVIHRNPYALVSHFQA